MNRNRTRGRGRRVSPALLACLALTALPVLAQDDDERTAPEPLERTQRVALELGTWVAQPAGLEYAPASRLDPNDAFGAQLLPLTHGTEDDIRWRVAYRFPESHSEIAVSYYSHKTMSDAAASTPGLFVFGERLAFPAFAGYAIDGLADAYEASAETKLRDASIEYRRRLFAGDDGLELHGSIGWRRVWHLRSQQAVYRALLPDLPPLLPPFSPVRPDLDPLPDTAALGSRFEGRGLTAGLDLELPLWRDRLLVEAAVDVAVLRGETDADYRSQTWLYTFDGAFLSPAFYDLFGEQFEDPPGSGEFTPFATFIDQETSLAGLGVEGRSTTADTMGIELGLRWRARDWLDVFAGFRSARYTGVGIDLTPGPLGSVVGGAQDFRQVDRSATYEGFYAGVSLLVF